MLTNPRLRRRREYRLRLLKGRFRSPMTDVPVQRFPALDNLAVIQHGFTLRVSGLDVRTDRATPLERISGYHQAILEKLGPRVIRSAEQIHGNGVAIDDQRSPEQKPG